jgi:hypothetical protein
MTQYWQQYLWMLLLLLLQLRELWWALPSPRHAGWCHEAADNATAGYRQAGDTGC